MTYYGYVFPSQNTGRANASERLLWTGVAVVMVVVCLAGRGAARRMHTERVKVGEGGLREEDEEGE